MSEPTLFERIAQGDIPADIVYQDDRVTAFHDIAPQAPVHILVVPNRAIATVHDAQPGDEALLGHLLLTAGAIARDLGLDTSGYRLIVNNGPDAGQEVFHLHVHILAGRALGPIVQPPG